MLTSCTQGKENGGEKGFFCLNSCMKRGGLVQLEKEFSSQHVIGNRLTRSAHELREGQLSGKLQKCPNLP